MATAIVYQHFVYKLNYVTTIGGITPPQPDGGDLGMAVYGEWYLGRVDVNKLNYFQRVSEFNINPITNDEAEGFKLLNVTQVKDGETMRDLNATELALKQKAIALIAKLQLRPRVVAYVGDQDDQLSDMAKRIALLERCFIMLAHAQMTEANAPTIPEPWKTIMETFYTDFTGGTLKDPIDIRPDGYAAVYATLKERSNILTTQLQQYYSVAMPSG